MVRRMRARCKNSTVVLRALVMQVLAPMSMRAAGQAVAVPLSAAVILPQCQAIRVCYKRTRRRADRAGGGRARCVAWAQAKRVVRVAAAGALLHSFPPSRNAWCGTTRSASAVANHKARAPRPVGASPAFLRPSVCSGLSAGD